MVIYKIVNNSNGKIYIGQTITGLSKRFNRHCRGSNESAISRAIKKYGKENFTILEIEKVNTIEELNKQEVYYINKFDCICPKGYTVKFVYIINFLFI